MSYASLRQKLFSGFYGFWVRNYRVGLMIVALISLLGISNLFTVPKESMPEIKFGIVQIGTAYIGVSPEEIDSLITTRIEKELQGIKGIDTIQSSSQSGFSSIVVTLTTDADIDKTVQQIKDHVEQADLPTDATDPVVSEISVESQQIYSIFLSNTNPNTPRDVMMATARDIQKKFEGNYGVESVNISGGSASELEVIILGEKLQALGITTNTIADIIRSYNQSFPLGNFTLDTKNYDLRIEGKIASFQELMTLPISL